MPTIMKFGAKVLLNIKRNIYLKAVLIHRLSCVKRTSLDKTYSLFSLK